MTGSSSASRPERAHILLAEDHTMLRGFLEMSLTAEGFRVTAVKNGDEAHAVLENGMQADLLFSDIRMAGALDGLQLACWVRKHRPAMAILLQTGFTELLTGDFPVLRKPYSPAELIDAIRAALPKPSVGCAR